MDALLRQLLRQQQANPFDADLARRLDAALLRGGGSDLVSSEPLLMHASAQGCLFDLCPQKELLDERIRVGTICAPCRLSLIAEQSVSPALVEAVESLQAAGRLV